MATKTALKVAGTDGKSAFTATQLTYTVGDTTTSSSGPGIFLIRNATLGDDGANRAAYWASIREPFGHSFNGNTTPGALGCRVFEVSYDTANVVQDSTEAYDGQHAYELVVVTQCDVTCELTTKEDVLGWTAS